MIKCGLIIKICYKKILFKTTFFSLTPENIFLKVEHCRPQKKDNQFLSCFKVASASEHRPPSENADAVVSWAAFRLYGADFALLIGRIKDSCPADDGIKGNGKNTGSSVQGP
jgi:hypothetical protein